MLLPPRPDDDPRPEPPECPDNDDCCHSGCDPCIFDLYQEERDRYRAALAAWEVREAARRAASKAPPDGRESSARPAAPAGGKATREPH